MLARTPLAAAAAMTSLWALRTLASSRSMRRSALRVRNARQESDHHQLTRQLPGTIHLSVTLSPESL